MNLPLEFLTRPIAHRGLHDRSRGIVENSRAAFEAAINAGYGIELDVQLSADDQALVFHDYDLRRLTGAPGVTRTRGAHELRELQLQDSQNYIEGLGDIMALIAGRVPVLIELKDQDGAMGPNIGALEEAVASVLYEYSRPVAVMSFNPHSVKRMAGLLPDTPRGLVTSSYHPEDWPLAKPVADRLREIPDYDTAKACFISHQADDLTRPRVQQLKNQGAAILCWTVRSEAQAQQALQIAHNITFEGYLPS